LSRTYKRAHSTWYTISVLPVLTRCEDLLREKSFTLNRHWIFDIPSTSNDARNRTIKIETPSCNVKWKHLRATKHFYMVKYQVRLVFFSTNLIFDIYMPKRRQENIRPYITLFQQPSFVSLSNFVSFPNSRIVSNYT